MTTHDYLEIAKNALDSKLLTFFILNVLNTLTTFSVNLIVLMQFLLGVRMQQLYKCLPGKYKKMLLFKNIFKNNVIE
jgi:hypothetical protein